MQTPPVARTGESLDQPGLHHTVDEPRQPALAEQEGAGELGHREALARRHAQLGECIVGNGAAFSFIPLLGISRGVANPGLYFTAIAISSIVARLLTGRIADRR